MEKWLDMVKAFACNTTQSMYIIDYYRQEFIYVSEIPFFLCGYSAEKVKELGYRFYVGQIPPEEIPALREIVKSGRLFYSRFSSQEKKRYTLSSYFHLKKGGGKILINHKFTPFTFKEEKIWLGVCSVSMSTHDHLKNPEILVNGHVEWRFCLESLKWKRHPMKELTDKEKDILYFPPRGIR
ncbi:MAG: hypothetical protein LUD15_13240 [Bacteroides sp.]|nr:hypothetical protein [Bacteroides sp.]